MHVVESEQRLIDCPSDCSLLWHTVFDNFCVYLLHDFAAFVKWVHQTEHLQVFAVVGFDNGGDEGVVHHAQDVVLTLYELFVARLEPDLLQHKAHAIVIQLLNDKHLTHVSRADPLAFEVNFVDVVGRQHAFNFEKAIVLLRYSFTLAAVLKHVRVKIFASLD